MHLLRILRNRLRALLGRDVVVDEIHEEIQFHLDERIVEHERRGLSPEEARRAAIRKFGNLSVVQDQGYDVRGGGMMESFMQDVRYGVRLLWKQRGFSTVALITLALGTGATTAIFCVVDAALIRPLPYAHPAQLVRVYLLPLSRPDGGSPPPSLADMDDWRTLTHIFSHLGTVKTEATILLERADPERVVETFATLDYLPMYGRTPFIGRAFTASDEQLGAPPVAILGYRFWQSHFQGDPAVLGRTLKLSDEPATIIGVLPDDRSRTQTALWRPLQASVSARNAHQYAAWARLRDGVTIEQAQSETSALAARLEKERPANKGLGVRITREYDNATRFYRPTINVLLGAVGFVLLIACVNVASLQLARGATRETELAIRASIGAGRGRLVRQMLTESIVLSLVGSALGALLAWLLLDTLVANIPVRISSDVQVRLNGWVLAVTIGLAVITGVLFGLVPALKLSRTELNAVLGRGSRGIRSTVSKTASRMLVTVEVAAAVLLVAGAALMIRSFARLSSFDLGFDPNGFVTMEVQPVDPGAQTFATFYPALLDRLRVLPGVTAVGATNDLPLGGSYSASRVRTIGEGGERFVPISVQQVVPGYFEALALPLRSGRFVQQSDMGGAAWVTLSEQAAASIFPNGGAVGQRVEYKKVWHDVIGVVGNVWALGPERAPFPHIYVGYDPVGGASLAGRRNGQPMVVIVRPAAGAVVSEAALREAARAIGPPVLVRRVRAGGEWWSDNIVTPRQRTVLLGILGGLGLLLALVGVFGVTSFTVSRRIPEIGVRLAFGARPGQVVGTMVRDASMPIAAGIAIGLVAAFFLSSVIATFLFKTTPRDPLAFAAVAVTLAAGGAIAAWIPARRAARVDPVVALRDD
jgi:putative ABC transport system permease protein